LNLLRFAYFFLLATFWPSRLQAIADKEYQRDLATAEGVRDSYWLLGCDVQFMELRSAEIWRECWVNALCGSKTIFSVRAVCASF
jgi:hypothetical protein